MSRPRILLIDDDPFMRSLVTAMLRGDFRISVANDGMQGFVNAVERPPDIVIVDIEMPGWDGLETINMMRSDEQLERIPVMVLTADDTRKTVLDAVNKGASDYLIKTALSREKLTEKVRRLLRNRPTAISRSPNGQRRLPEGEGGA